MTATLWGVRPRWPITGISASTRARTVAARDEIVALYDERFFRMWTFYLAGAACAFEHGGLVNYQLQFARSRTALPVTRDYIGAAEARLRA